MRILFAILLSYFFVRFFLNVNDFIFFVYSLTSVSSFLPFPIVAIVVWLTLILGLIAILVTLKDVRRGIEWVIIFLPMSALPFIWLGVPLGALNNFFIFRSLLNLFVYILFFTWFLRFVVDKKYSLKFPLWPAVGMLLFAYLCNVSYVKEEIRFNVILSCIILISCVLFFYLIINFIRDENRLIRIVEIMVIACVVQVFLSSLSFFYYLIVKGRAFFRVEGMLRDFELFAEYLALHIPLFIYLLRNPGHLINRTALKIFMIMTIFVLLATATRGAIISLAFGLVYYVIQIRSRVSLPRIALQAAFWGFVVGMLLIILYKALPASAQILERFAGTNISTLDTRHFVWQKFWRYFQDKPIAGYGMAYNMEVYLFFPHSTYFYYLLAMGIPGCLVYLILLLSLFIKGRENVNRAHSEGNLFEIAAAINTMLLMFAIDSIKIEYLRYPNYQLFIWLLFALIVVVNQLLSFSPKDENLRYQ